MRRILTYTGAVLGSVLLLGLVGAGALYLGTSGDYQVPATVTDDPALPRVKLDGYTFHAETFGEVGKPVVIVVHGGPGGDYRSLLGLRALADDYRVVFYDQRGSGLSERVPAAQLSYQVALEDLDAFVRLHARDQPVILIGHSWGVMLVSGYLGVAPQSVAKAVIAEPGFLTAREAQAWREQFNAMMSGPTYWWLVLRSGFAALHVEGPDRYASEDFLVGANILPYFTNHPDNPYHCPGEPYDAPAWRWGAAASRAIQGGASDEDLNSLSANAGDYGGPVLFLAGACNTWIGPALQAKHATLYANATLEVIPDAGHDMFWDNPEKALEVVRAFLAL